jgi:hypothetical protein
MAKNLRVFVSLVHVGRLLFKTLNVLYDPNSLVTPTCAAGGAGKAERRDLHFPVLG